jgi:hypothetical protein
MQEKTIRISITIVSGFSRSNVCPHASKPNIHRCVYRDNNSHKLQNPCVYFHIFYNLAIAYTTIEFLVQEKYPLSCTTHGKIRSIFVEIFALDRNRIRYNVLLNACIYGHTEVVRLLLADPTVHPGDQESLPVNTDTLK